MSVIDGIEAPFQLGKFESRITYKLKNEITELLKLDSSEETQAKLDNFLRNAVIPYWRERVTKQDMRDEIIRLQKKLSKFKATYWFMEKRGSKVELEYDLRQLIYDSASELTQENYEKPVRERDSSYTLYTQPLDIPETTLSNGGGIPASKDYGITSVSRMNALASNLTWFEQVLEKSVIKLGKDKVGAKENWQLTACITVLCNCFYSLTGKIPTAYSSSYANNGIDGNASGFLLLCLEAFEIEDIALTTVANEVIKIKRLYKNGESLPVKPIWPKESVE